MNNRGFVIIIVIGLLIISGIAFYLLWQNSLKAEAPITPRPTSSQSSTDAPVVDITNPNTVLGQ